jgi:hypothetical protein
MATKRDIADFNIGSILQQVQGVKRKTSKENKWKTLVPQLFTGLIGVYDKYQEDKLSRNLETINFENALELGKQRAEANKFAKIYKDTEPLAKKLREAGAMFSDSNLQDEGNFKAVETVLGTPSWNTVKSNFNSVAGINSDRFQTYQDFQNNGRVYGRLDKPLQESIDNAYRNQIKNKFNYIVTGQSADIDRINAAIATLESMDIDPKMIEGGLLGKVNKTLQNNLNNRDLQIDSYRNTYLTAPIQKAQEALDLFEKSKSPNEYLTEVNNIDFANATGFSSILNDEQFAVYTLLADNHKTKVRNVFEALVNEDPDIHNNPIKVQGAMNNAITGTLHPSGATIYFREYFDSQNELVKNNIKLSDDEKNQKVLTNEAKYNEIIKTTSSITSREQAQNYISVYNAVNYLKEEIKNTPATDATTRSILEMNLKKFNRQLNQPGLNSEFNKVYDVMDVTTAQRELAKTIINQVDGEDDTFDQNYINSATLDPTKAFLVNTYPSLTKLLSFSYKPQNLAQGEARRRIDQGISNNLKLLGDQYSGDFKKQADEFISPTSKNNASQKETLYNLLDELSQESIQQVPKKFEGPFSGTEIQTSELINNYLPQLLFGEKFGDDYLGTDEDGIMVLKPEKLNKASLRKDLNIIINDSIKFEESLEGSPNSFVRYNSKLNTYTVPLIKSQSDLDQLNIDLTTTKVSPSEIVSLVRKNNDNVIFQDGKFTFKEDTEKDETSFTSITERVKSFNEEDPEANYRIENNRVSVNTGKGSKSLNQSRSAKAANLNQEIKMLEKQQEITEGFRKALLKDPENPYYKKRLEIREEELKDRL